MTTLIRVFDLAQLGFCLFGTFPPLNAKLWGISLIFSFNFVIVRILGKVIRDHEFYDEFSCNVFY